MFNFIQKQKYKSESLWFIEFLKFWLAYIPRLLIKYLKIDIKSWRSSLWKECSSNKTGYFYGECLSSFPNSVYYRYCLIGKIASSEFLFEMLFATGSCEHFHTIFHISFLTEVQHNKCVLNYCRSVEFHFILFGSVFRKWKLKLTESWRSVWLVLTTLKTLLYGCDPTIQKHVTVLKCSVQWKQVFPSPRTYLHLWPIPSLHCTV